MPSTIRFKSTGFPGATVVSVRGTDAVIKPPDEPTLHITLHGSRATLVGGLVTVSYNASAWYHVAVRPGVYFARIFKNKKWEDYPAQTTGSFETDKKHAKEYSLDIEPFLVVS